MDTKEVVLYDSPEAASYQAWEGWVSRDGRFWGANEHMARWAGCTHKACPNCGTVNEVSSSCNRCRDGEMAAKFAAYPVEKWDGETPLCLFGGARYFFGHEVLDWLADHPEEVRICKCKPGYLSEIDRSQWAHELPADGDLPAEVEEALAALNAAIADAGPSCWREDAVAVNVADLRRRLVESKAQHHSHPSLLYC
jgi:hypothetical protein